MSIELLIEYISNNPSKRMRTAKMEWIEGVYNPTFYKFDEPEVKAVDTLFVIFPSQRERGIARMYFNEISAYQEATRYNISTLEEYSGCTWHVAKIEITPQNKSKLSGRNEEMIKDWIMTHPVNMMHQIWEKIEAI